MDNILELCIKQGYVKKECKLDGILVWDLISAGKRPCDGCNADCRYKNDIPLEQSKEYLNYVKDIKEQKEKEERIKKRKSLETNSQPFVYIDSDYRELYATVIDPDSEKGYSIKLVHNHDEAAHYICILCKKYLARQIIISFDAHTAGIYNSLQGMNLKDIDIVPIRYVSARM